MSRCVQLVSIGVFFFLEHDIWRDYSNLIITPTRRNSAINIESGPSYRCFLFATTSNYQGVRMFVGVKYDFWSIFMVEIVED